MLLKYHTNKEKTHINTKEKQNKDMSKEPSKSNKESIDPNTQYSFQISKIEFFLVSISDF